MFRLFARAWLFQRDSFLLCAAAAAILLGWRGEPPLTSFLVLSPLIGAGFLPIGWWSRRWSLPIAAAVAVAAGHWPLVMQVVEARSWNGAVVWWPTLAKSWSMAGLGLCVLAALVHWAGRFAARPLIRAAGMLAILLTFPAVAIPLPMIYRYHVTWRSDGFPEGQRFTVRSDAPGIDLDTLFLPAKGEERGVVLFTHGVGRWKEFYQGHLQFLRGCGWSVLCYDLRGHGRSSPSAMTYGTREVADLAAEWREARSRAHGLPVVAYGVSLGGGITLLGAHRLDGCAGVIAESAFADLESLVDRFLKPPFDRIGRGLAWAGLGWRLSMVRPIDAPILPSGPPLLLGWTALDRVVPPDHGDRLAARASRAELVESQTAIHTGMIRETQWRAAVARFLERIASRP
ncbi:MAG: alpha/beta fold hydrolase [Planctomycetes bacterium]|nr:alpha/beta fold hydrolase [Planctomycetota bacterium]